MILKLLWPDICPFCGKISRKGVCPVCQKKINNLSIEQPYCMKCGKPVLFMEQEYCYDCSKSIHYFESGRALWLHKPPVNHSIYHFKYHNQRQFGKLYARAMAEKYGGTIRQWNPDIIIPVPLHKIKRKQRGFNQAQVIAEELGKIMGVSVNSFAVKRVRYTKPQKKMDHKLRKSNLKNAFEIAVSLQKIKCVLLVDDIYTTGNTLDEVAKILKQAGVQKVYFLTVSIGQGN